MTKGRTFRVPTVTFDLENGYFSIKGRSTPENAKEFYEPYIQQIKEYINQPCANTIFDVFLEHINTSTQKCLFEIFRLLEQIPSENRSIILNWYFEEQDEDMQEYGEDFKEVVGIPVDLIKVPDPGFEEEDYEPLLD